MGQNNNKYVVTKTAVDLVIQTEAGPRIGGRDTQLLYGETFSAQREDDDWVYGVSDVDGYEGYIYKTNLSPIKQEPTHIVASLGTHIYPEPDFKARPLMPLAFMSRVRAEDAQLNYGFVEVEDMGWVYATHLKKIAKLGEDKDIVSIAMKFTDAPYLYGGRTGLGLDCSALVQLALLYAGIPCPRDSVDQKNIGTEISRDELQKGDLVFFEGHVGMMVDENNMINATARSMDTRVEPLENVIQAYKDILTIRRVL